MSKKPTLGNPYYYWVELLNKDEDRICEPMWVFKTPTALHWWCQDKFTQMPEVHRIQVWFGAANPDNPNVEQDWVNSYCREPFCEFGEQAMKINRTGRSIQVTGAGERFEYFTALPTVYTLTGRWWKPTQRKGKKQKRYTPVNWEEIA